MKQIERVTFTRLIKRRGNLNALEFRCVALFGERVARERRLKELNAPEFILRDSERLVENAYQKLQRIRRPLLDTRDEIWKRIEERNSRSTAKMCPKV